MALFETVMVRDSGNDVEISDGAREMSAETTSTQQRAGSHLYTQQRKAKTVPLLKRTEPFGRQENRKITQLQVRRYLPTEAYPGFQELWN